MKKKKIALKDKILRKQKWKNVIIYVMLMKINNRISLQQFLPLSEAETQGLLHPAEANLGYFLLGFSVSSRPQHSPKALLVLNVTCLLMYVLNCEQNLSFFIFRSGLTVTVLALDYCYMLY
jgi:hypothetical protein